MIRKDYTMELIWGIGKRNEIRIRPSRKGVVKSMTGLGKNIKGKPSVEPVKELRKEWKMG